MEFLAACASRQGSNTTLMHPVCRGDFSMTDAGRAFAENCLCCPFPQITTATICGCATQIRNCRLGGKKRGCGDELLANHNETEMWLRSAYLLCLMSNIWFVFKGICIKTAQERTICEIQCPLYWKVKLFTVRSLPLEFVCLHDASTKAVNAHCIRFLKEDFSNLKWFLFR
jgi:hypothetical protein